MEIPSISSPEEDNKKSVRQMFSPEEDKLLLALVKEYGDKNWRMIAKKMENRTTRQCRERYRNYLSPNLTNGPWTAEEDLLLEQKNFELGPKWATIAQSFKNRSDVNIKNRWASNRHKAIRIAPKNLIENLIFPKRQLLAALQAILPVRGPTSQQIQQLEYLKQIRQLHAMNSLKCLNASNLCSNINIVNSDLNTFESVKKDENNAAIDVANLPNNEIQITFAPQSEIDINMDTNCFPCIDDFEMQTLFPNFESCGSDLRI
ncbi:hypothetical protein TRFO_20274 [Tritrichomonas foetus]|uniref:Myb-like DNA-binding domain containing protein n=1 Tax=Tritrichomonas foetus TaxID=1144522 RepID=A0A1J4KHE9_9EUKA|nr:hypothetical protein TRFO_20274 [Tritrichomonas foetus]|eukprot:OHT10458.1 hypothetical protein TRFO_20274 [Tritrichomonas foetus]